MKRLMIVEKKNLKNARRAIRKFTGNKQDPRFGEEATEFKGIDEKEYVFEEIHVSEAYLERMEGSLQEQKLEYFLTSKLEDFNANLKAPAKKKAAPKKTSKKAEKAGEEK